MKVQYAFDHMSLGEDKLILSLKKKDKMEIPFCDLDAIYVARYNYPAVNKAIALLFTALFITLITILLFIELFPFIPAFLLIVALIKVKNYKRYELKILLKNGSFLKKDINISLKEETKYEVTNIRNHLFNYRLLHT